MLIFLLVQRKAKKLKRAGAASDESEDEQRAPDVADLFNERQEREKSKARVSDNLDMRARANRMFDEDEDDMADFIEEDSPDEEDREREDRQARKSREKERKRQRREEGFALSNLDITAECVFYPVLTQHPISNLAMLTMLLNAGLGMRYRRSLGTDMIMTRHSSKMKMKMINRNLQCKMCSNRPRLPKG